MDITSYLLGKQSGGGGVIGEEINITPSTSEQIITPSEGKNAITKVTVCAVDNTIDNNIIAGNIKKDVSILGVTGTLEGAGKFKPHEISFGNRNIKSGETSRVTALQNDINNIDTSEMTYMWGLFKGLFANTPLYEDEISLDLSGWDTSHVDNMNQIFADQYIPPFTLNISNVDFSAITKTNGLQNCFEGSKLKKLIVPSTHKTVDTAKFYSTFKNCSLIEELDLDFLESDIGRPADLNNGLQSTFMNCTSLKKVKMKNINFAEWQGANRIDYCFYGCTKLERIDIDSLDFQYLSTSSSNTRYCFTNCGSELPEGQYTKVYVKDQAAQNWILNLSSTHRPAGWSTANVIIAGSADDHRND